MPTIPIETIPIFPVLDKKLLELLRSLTPEEWNAPTVARLWTVKDVAAHLLDGNMRTISSLRDQYRGMAPIAYHTNEELVAALNQLNADWVNAMKRVSPQLLIELLELTGPGFYQEYSLSDPFKPAPFSVAWAGEAVSANWFHIAREYTEKWHHQQQIRDAVNKPGILTKELYYPVLDTFMLALPFVYRHTNAVKDTVVQVSISGDGGGEWYLVKKDRWELQKDTSLPVTAHTTIDGSVAWKLFSKSLRKKDVMNFIHIEGNKELGEVALEMVAVMA